MILVNIQDDKGHSNITFMIGGLTLLAKYFFSRSVVLSAGFFLSISLLLQS